MKTKFILSINYFYLFHKMSIITGEYKFSDIFEEVEVHVWKCEKDKEPPCEWLRPPKDKFNYEHYEMGYIQIKPDDFAFMFYVGCEGNSTWGNYESLHQTDISPFHGITLFDPNRIYKRTIINGGKDEIIQFIQTYCSVEKVFKVKRNSTLRFKSEQNFQHLVRRFHDENAYMDYIYEEPLCENISTYIENYKRYYVPMTMKCITLDKSEIPIVYDHFNEYISYHLLVSDIAQGYDPPDIEPPSFYDDVWNEVFHAFGIRQRHKINEGSFNRTEYVLYFFNPHVSIRFLIQPARIKCYIFTQCGQEAIDKYIY